MKEQRAVIRDDLHRLALARAADARALLQAHRYDAAYYLGGFAVECGIKACIAGLTLRHEFPDKRRADQAWAHDLPKLLNTAGLTQEMHKAPTGVQVSWDVVKGWQVEVRYILGKSQKESADSSKRLQVAEVYFLG